MWRAAMMECDICGTTWAGVMPARAVEAECPGCGHMCSVPGAWEYVDQLNGDDPGAG